MTQQNQTPDDDRTEQDTRPRRPAGGAPSGPNGTGYGYGSEAAALVEVLNRHELPTDVERLLESELNPDHILANLNEEEVRYRRFSLWNNKEMVLGSFPPDRSIWQGERRKEAAALDDGRTALTVEQVHGIRDAFDAAFARVSRSREGWQQDKLADQTEERRIVEERNEDSGGFLSKLMG